jgi:uncharacterized membrane protein YkoI
MKLARWLVAGVAVVLLAGVVGRADEKEEKVPLDKLPRAVVDAVKAKFPDAELVSAEKENEDGKTVYEVNIKFKGSTIEVTVTPEGKITSIEKEIAVKDLPKAVQEALDAKYPRATIKKTEEVTKGDKVSYEVLLVTADKKKLEVVFDPAGKVIEEEKKDGKEEKKEDKKDK